MRSPPPRITTASYYNDLVPPCGSSLYHRTPLLQDDKASSFTEDDVAEFAVGFKKGVVQTWLRILQSFARGQGSSDDTRWTTNDNAIVVEARLPPLPFLWHSEAEQSRSLTLLLVLLKLCGADAYEKRDASFLVCLVRKPLVSPAAGMR